VAKTENGRRTLRGSRLTHEESKRTTYTIKNNAAAPPSAAAEGAQDGAQDGGGGAPAGGVADLIPLYLEHAADMGHGGFSILTSERAIKQTTAFARFKFVLAPQEEIVFEVEEQASRVSLQSQYDSLKGVLDKPLSSSVLSPAVRIRLEALVEGMARRRLLQKVEAELSSAESVGSAVSERELHTWLEQGALPDVLLNGLSGLHALKAQRLDCQHKIASHQARVKEIFKNQDRLRENIKSFEKFGSNVLTERYLKDLDSEEDELVDVRKKVAQQEESSGGKLAEMKATLLVLGGEVSKLLDALDAAELDEEEQGGGA